MSDFYKKESKRLDGRLVVKHFYLNKKNNPTFYGYSFHSGRQNYKCCKCGIKINTNNEHWIDTLFFCIVGKKDEEENVVCIECFSIRFNISNRLFHMEEGEPSFKKINMFERNVIAAIIKNDSKKYSEQFVIAIKEIFDEF